MLKQQITSRFTRLHYIARHHDRHIGQALHGEQIFERLMGRTVGTHGNAAMGSRNHHIEVAIADRGPDLIEIARRGKCGVGSEHGQLPFPGQPGRGRGG